MKTRTFDRCRAAGGAALLCGLLAWLPAVAETLALRLAYANVPGTDLILEGRFDEAIALLERRTRADPENHRRDERGTLCGAYVGSRRWSEASAVCDDAVARDPGEVAFNNRGVLRMHLGDIPGAIEDFDRVQVRPDEMEAFLATLKERNVRLMATANMEIARLLAARRDATRDRKPARNALRGADIEDPTQSGQ